MEGKQIIATVLIIALVLLASAFLRSFFLWFFKIDVRIKLQERQNELLEHIANKDEKVTGDTIDSDRM